MKWFKHDSTASSDAKLKKLILKYGAEGYAIYFHCLELIANSINESNITFELEHDAEIVADNLKIKGTSEKSGIDVVNEIMRHIIDLGLFESDGQRVTCLKMLSRLDLSMTSNPGFRKMITSAKESHDGVMTQSCKTRLDKTRLDKTRERSTSPPPSKEKVAKEVKHKHGENKRVLLTDDQYEKLKEKLGSKREDYIWKLDEYLCIKEPRYKSHYHVILKWSRKDLKKDSSYTDAAVDHLINQL